ncbi:enoyl-CoA hydratase [Ammoniphilus oxalaticus]|uniref:Enoyl-CoA hydratase n=1 Tax=Ammoniphilus oxalaticus TaxID=66863 RepID=A0A419SIL5_9BACL|nr:enoyl-CoA hydratase-related protein [Ammoniphilus oxalaticus]RKD23835.1 enoyl-CoA hydratase [Ammoniphilus oxalaticus]
MKFTHVDLRVENRVGYVTIYRPPVNALNSEVFVGLSACLDYVEASEQIKVVALTGAGRFFVAGADVKELAQAFGDEKKGAQLATVGQKVFDRIERFSKPVIAVINGPCLGGGLELALSCHLRLATEQAALGLPELTLGLIPGFAGTQRLPRMIGKAKALELLLMGHHVNGLEAERLGLVNLAVPNETLSQTAKKWSENIALEKSGRALSAALQAVHDGLRLPLQEGQALEAELFGQLFCTEDAREGVSAFLEKRKAVFKDR